MGIITGYLCAISLLFLLLKYVARKLKWEKLNCILMKLHKYIACAFLLLAIVHLSLTIRVFTGRALVVIISGIVILSLGMVLTIVCHMLKNRNLEKKFHQFLSLLMALFFIVHVTTYFIDFHNYKAKIDNIKIHEIDLTTVEDGVYVGEYEAGYVYAKVQVIVEQHEIVDVVILKHVTERGKPAEIIAEQIVKKQRIYVDAVTHATNSSNVIKQACINALEE